jgi:hypothetical protein
MHRTESARFTLAFLFTVLCYPLTASAWNIPSHMITGAIAHRLLRW